MKQFQIIEACKAIKKLVEYELPITESYKVYKLFKALQVHYDFQTQEESKLFKEYKVSFDDKQNLKFPDGDSFNNFINKLEEIKSMEVELDSASIALMPVKIKIKDSITLTAKEIQNLEGFIEFEE